MIAKAFQAFDQSPSGVFRLQPVKKVGPGFAVGLLTLEHVVGYDQNREGHGENRAFLAAPRREPPVLRTEIGAFGPRGSMGRLSQSGPHWESASCPCRSRRRAFPPCGGPRQAWCPAGPR